MVVKKKTPQISAVIAIIDQLVRVENEITQNCWEEDTQDAFRPGDGAIPWVEVCRQ